MGTMVILALASIIFLSTLLITAALMLRGRWERMGEPRQPPN